MVVTEYNIGATMQSKWLYQKSKTGKTVQWRVFTEDNYLFTEFGQVGGKLQTSAPQECFPTNVDRSNARNAQEQAEFEALALYNHKLDTKYSKTLEQSEITRISPMLAQDGKKVKFAFSVAVQRKFDGARALTIWEGGKPKLLSRGNKFYSVPHIEKQLAKILKPGQMLDGELYIHGMSLQQIMSYVKKNKPGSEKLQYHVYDVPSNKMWVQRSADLAQINFSGDIVQVDTYIVDGMEELISYHDIFVKDGYEGAIIRLGDGLYEYGKRSRSLLKWKDFEDAEFLILGATPGVGKFAEVPIFTVQNNINDLTFNVTPTGTAEVRKEYMNPKYIGQYLTVRFKGRSEDGIPKIAVGKCIRPSEDMGLK